MLMLFNIPFFINRIIYIMAAYPPPENNLSIFAPSNFLSSDDALTIGEADALYLAKTGGSVLGNLLPVPTLTYDLGSVSQEWGNVFCAGLTASIVANSQRFLSTGDTSAQNEFFPAISHSTEPATGMYFPLDNTLGLSTNGINSALFDVNGIQTGMAKINSAIGIQNAVNPAISHISDLNTGIYFPLSDVLGLTAGGVSSATFGTNGFLSGVQPFLYAEHNIEQKIANNTATAALFNTTLQSQGTAISISGAGVVTVSQTGIYMFYAKINWVTNAGTGFLREIYFNVSSLSGRRPGTVKVQITPTLQLVQSCSMCVKLTAGNSVSLTVFQNTNLDEQIGANANIALSNELMVYRVA
jgi:hypothetical protein